MKITTIVGFVIMIQRIFPSRELAPTHSRLLFRDCQFIYFHSLMKSAFIFSKGLLCSYDKLLLLRSLVSYQVKHSKRNSISTCTHVLISIYLFLLRGHGNKSCDLIGSLPSQYFPISAHGPWLRFRESPNTSQISLPFFYNISRFSGWAVFLS